MPRRDGIQMSRYDGIQMPRRDGIQMPRYGGIQMPRQDEKPTKRSRQDEVTEYIAIDVAKTAAWSLYNSIVTMADNVFRFAG